MIARLADRVDSDRLRALQSITDAALAYLPLEQLLAELLTRVVEIVSADTAAILLLDDEGQTLVARAAKGLEEEVERGVRVPVRAGFAGRIAATGQPVRIENVERADIHNPILREKGLKSLMGVPLLVEGDLLGVLHVGSLRPRSFSDGEVEVLQRAADRAALAIHGRLAEQERGLADALQRSLIPRLPDLPGVLLEARYLPAASARLGGDWYDVFPLPEGNLGLAIGDVSGRGFQAAALMGQLRSGLRACAMDDPAPALVAERLSALLRQLEPGRNATLLYLMVDPHEGRLAAISAGHPAPLVIDADGGAAYLELPNAVPLGAVRYPRYRSVEAPLAPGSTLLLYTDGVIERPGETLDAGLVRLVDAAVGTAPRALCGRVVEKLLPHGADRDDAALVVAHFENLADPLELSLEAEIESIPVVRRVLGRWLRDAGATRMEIDEIGLACSEACANAIEHAYGPTPARLALRAVLEGDRTAVVHVRDSGSWREPRGGPRGRGQVLMNGLMDSVEIDRGSSGTTVRLARRLGGERG
jgi:anti-sigma regulatory factor (Ser/Thr protein kinase)/putative methionine-R-sulfoxide reductase with GAF domain